MSDLTKKSSVKVFGGTQERWTHRSAACDCTMTFSVFFPPAEGPTPVLYWLSGLTCTDENFATKSGFARAAAAHGVTVVIPDTSPRGVDIEGQDDAYDFGSGAGFYVDATEPKCVPSPQATAARPAGTPPLHATRHRWSGHYKMYSYITKELPELVAAQFAGKVTAKRSIFGHSMGGAPGPRTRAHNSHPAAR